MIVNSDRELQADKPKNARSILITVADKDEISMKFFIFLATELIITP
jgi:hypothetical protein